MLPFLLAVQEAAARVGLVTRKGLTEVLREHYPKWLLYTIVILLLLANVINLGADLGAMAASARLILPLPELVYLAVFFVNYRDPGSICHLCQVCADIEMADPFAVCLCNYRIDFSDRLAPGYPGYVFAALGMVLGFFAYFCRRVRHNHFPVHGVLAGQPGKEELEERRAERLQAPRITRNLLFRMRLDTFVGMLFSEVTTWFIIVTAATVLHGNGIRTISTAQQAASALLPLVHNFAHAGEIASCCLPLASSARFAGHPEFLPLHQPMPWRRYFPGAKGWQSRLAEPANSIW